MLRIFAFLLAAIGVSVASLVPSKTLLAGSHIPGNLKAKSVSIDELGKWSLWGNGQVYRFGKQLVLREDDKTKGVMLVSPDRYKGDVAVSYDVVALTPATVIVTMLAISNPDGTALSIPEGYDGNIGLWLKKKASYFFAFKNAPHARRPFVRRTPNAKTELVEAAENVMVAGRPYSVVVSKIGGVLSLSVDGKEIFKTTDAEPLGAGHLALRLRGVRGFPAGVTVRNFKVYSAN